jgi:hypothetical protein
MASHRRATRGAAVFSASEPRRRRAHPSSSDPFVRAGSDAGSDFEDHNYSDEEEGSSCAIMNRCSPKNVYTVVCKFSEFKKQCVRDIGFGGLLDLPLISKVNLKLSAWLLSKLDAEESSIVVSESRRLYVHEKDVGIVFGIPCGDLDVGAAEISREQIDIIRGDCGLNCSRSFKGLEQLLAKHLDDRSLRQEVNRFKTAFVIFVMGHLLAPSVKHDHGNIDYWGALKDPEMIHRFNWCRYVHYNVLQSAVRARDEIVRKGRVTALTGCHFFLQVL